MRWQCWGPSSPYFSLPASGFKSGIVIRSTNSVLEKAWCWLGRRQLVWV